jgi:hypothetical protein
MAILLITQAGASLDSVYVEADFKINTHYRKVAQNDITKHYSTLLDLSPLRMTRGITHF